MEEEEEEEGSLAAGVGELTDFETPGKSLRDRSPNKQ